MAEVEFKDAFKDIGKDMQRKMGMRLERAMIRSLKELQKRFDEIVLFDVVEGDVYRVSSSPSKYQLVLNKYGIGRLAEKGGQMGSSESILDYVRRCSRFDEKAMANSLYNQVTIANRILEIYRGVKRPKKIEIWHD